jgi:mRNA interferase RelE/StbE
MLSLDLTRQAYGFLNELESKQFRQVVRKIFSLLENPRPADAKQLQGYFFWRTDIGEYRIVYRVEKNILKIAVVDKRNDDEVYKKLKFIS